MQQFSLAYTLTMMTTGTRHVKMITEKMNKMNNDGHQKSPILYKPKAYKDIQRSLKRL